jgi:hypothetical protein
MVMMAMVWSTGCILGGDPLSGSTEPAGVDPVGQVQQAVTGCELDCPGGTVLTCGLPCSVPDSNTIVCNGVTSHCPPPSCVPHGCGGACGPQDDGCGNPLDCGPCDTCPTGRVDCCGDGVCVSPTLCHKLILQGTC